MFLAQRLLDRVNNPLEVGVIGVWLGGVVGQVPPLITEQLRHQLTVRTVEIFD